MPFTRKIWRGGEIIKPCPLSGLVGESVRAGFSVVRLQKICEKPEWEWHHIYCDNRNTDCSSCGVFPKRESLVRELA